MEKEREREENECTKMLKSAQVRKDGCGAGFVSPKGLPKSSRAVLIVAGTTHTHNIGRWVLWLWDAQGTTVRGKMDVGPALSAPKACQKQRSSVDCSWNHTHTQHWVMG